MMPSNRRYRELLAGLYLGQAPAWMPTGSLAQWSVASERRRLDVFRRFRLRFPRASFYANAKLGSNALQRVCEALVEQPGKCDSLMSMVDDAVALWLSRQDSRALLDVFRYDCFLRSSPVYDGPDTAALRARHELPEDFSVATFEHDVLGFGKLLDLLLAYSAPSEIVCANEPIQRRQLLAVYERNGVRRVRDITNGAKRL